MKTLLLVDDEKRMLELLSLYLTPYYHCIQANSGNEAILKMDDEQIDLILLDVMMPDMDGWSTCAEIRKFSDVPIIMVSARNEKIDIVKGLRMGADDYITKPFDEGELLARIEAVYRRYQSKHLKRINFNGLMWDEESYELKYEGEIVQTTPKEFLLLGLLLRNPNRVFSRAHLLETIWGNKKYTEDRTVDSHIRNVRDKLRRVNFPIDHYLTTVWGVGYKWASKDQL